MCSLDSSQAAQQCHTTQSRENLDDDSDSTVTTGLFLQVFTTSSQCVKLELWNLMA